MSEKTTRANSCSISRLYDNINFGDQISKYENELDIVKSNLKYCIDRIDAFETSCDNKYASYIEKCATKVELANNNTYTARDIIDHCYAGEMDLKYDSSQSTDDMTQSLLHAVHNCTFDVFFRRYYLENCVTFYG